MTASPDAAGRATIRSLRRFILGTFLLGLVGTGAELLLVKHVDGFWQLVPVILIGLSLIVAAAVVRGGGPVAVRAHQGLMVLFVLSGFVGLVLHYNANAEFELEMYPDLGGFPLLWKAIQGASPPSLAPGAMMGLGLLGLAYTYHSPALRRWSAGNPDSPGATP